MKKRTEILESHPYKIYQGNDGKWRTYLPDQSKATKRRLIKRNTEKEVQEVIISHYRGVSNVPTLESVYPKWLHYYSLRCESVETIRRATIAWRKYYADTDLIKKPLSSLTKIKLETWVLELVRKHSMTKKQYFNMSLPLRQMMKYAKDCGYIKTNPFEDIRVNPKLFRKQKKKPSETQVYFEKEEVAIISEAWKEFYENPDLGAPLALIFIFYTGVRLGEVVAFKDTDIEGSFIWVNRMERKQFSCDDGLAYHQQENRDLVEHAKTEAGNRKIYLTTEARKVLVTALFSARKKGFEQDFFLFMNGTERVTSDCVRYRLRKYCKKLNIPFRSPHKIRKTYISKLIDSGVNINTIRELVGHEDERTTYNSYCFDRHSKEEINQQLENALQVFNGIQNPPIPTKNEKSGER